MDEGPDVRRGAKRWRVGWAMASALAIVGGLSCMTRGGRPDGRLRVIASVPRDPAPGSDFRITKLGETELPSSAISLAAADGVVYVAMSLQGMAAVDVSDPSAPRTVWRQEGLIDPEDQGARVVLEVRPEPGRLLVTDRLQGLSVYGIDDPLRPEPLWDLRFPGIESDQPISITRVGDIYYFACGGAGLKSLPVDFGPGDVPRAHLTAFDYTMNSVAFGPRWLLVADNYYTGMQVLDLSAPGGTRVVHLFQPGTFCDRVIPMGGYVVLANREMGFTVADMRDPAAPFAANFYYTPPRSGSIIKSMVGWRERFILAGNAFQYIEVFDLEDPERPRKVRRIETDGEVNAMAVRGDLLFVSFWERARLAVYRMSVD